MAPDQPFVYFDKWEEVSTYRCNLPHWRQDGVLYFVTFRLGDSLPKAVVEKWLEERRLWLTARGLKTVDELAALPRAERFQFAKHFNRQVHIALDSCCGQCWLRRTDIAQLVVDAFQVADERDYALGDYVVMPNHVHVLVAPKPPQSLEQILKRWKGATARHANARLYRAGQFWHRESYDRIVRNEEELMAFRKYIAENPQKSRLPESEYLLGCGSLFGE